MRRFVLLLPVLGFGQETIKVTTRLIETNVIVRDHHGPVADLTAAAFKLFDSGKEQKIAVFRVSKREAASPAAAVPMLPAGVFSNRFAKSAARPARHTMLLIDTLNTDFSHQVFVREQVLLMLKSTEIIDPTAIYILGDNSRLIQDFTMDRDLLTKAVRKLFMSNEPTPPCLGAKLSCDGLKRSFQEIRDHANQDRALHSLDAFEQVGEFLARVPGGKSVVWISDSFPAKSFNREERFSSPYAMVAEKMQRLNRADVTIYAVHARGLMVGVTGLIANPRGGPSVASLANETDTLNWVAEETGGRAFYNRNDVGAAIQEAIDDGEITYTLGFYSQRDKPDGNFHALKVKVDRPGVDVRHRTGYFDVEAKPDAAPSSIAESASDIGLIGAAARKGASFEVAVQIDFKDLHLREESGRWKGSAELAFATLSAGGQALDVKRKTLTFDMTEDAYQARRREGFALEEMLPVRDGVKAIRVVVVESSGVAGSVTIVLN